ncbi:hypothetical protein GIB67_042487 [Kingdonia uniflora]|uniref:t-SNARE coiled-coil homology domain-containing protein n=1 Tax=Kingdonia uniflora TaxID=39325 RepID=A0A7J7M170_9MAGN|nr:hypothetical protein GIB67_042487 [Kingdonia uniflora]
MSFQDLESGRPLGSRRGYINGKQDSTQAVASGVFQINTAVSTFQRLVNTLGTPKDTPELREKLVSNYPVSDKLKRINYGLVKWRLVVSQKAVVGPMHYYNGSEAHENKVVVGIEGPVGHKTRVHIGQLVKDTSAKLKQASETDQNSEVSASKKIADAKLAKDFQAVLKEFQKAQRLAAERETAYAPFVPQTVLPSSYTAGELDISSDRSPEHRALLVESRRQEVLLLDNEIVFNEAIIEEREQGIQEIQQQIGEVNEIFKDLAVLVHDQGAIIDDIGSNIENSAVATSQAKSQLVKASKTQKSNSSLYIKIQDFPVTPIPASQYARVSEHHHSILTRLSKYLSARLNLNLSSPADLLAFGDIWGCPSHRDHSSDSLTNQALLVEDGLVVVPIVEATQVKDMVTVVVISGGSWKYNGGGSGDGVCGRYGGGGAGSGGLLNKEELSF